MNILFLTEEPITFSGTMVRGGQIHVRNVVDGLRERGHDVHLVDWNAEPERPYQHSIEPRLRVVVNPVRTYRRAVSIGRDADIDVIVSKTRKTYLPGLAAARRLGVAHVVHVGSSLDRPTSGLLECTDVASLDARLRAPHDAYFVVCEYIAKQLRERRVETGQIYDVRNAVDTERFRPDHAPEPLETRFVDRIPDHDGLTLGYVGGLQTYKGLTDLARTLDNQDHDCRLLVAGDGPLRNQLEVAFAERATFLGAVPYEQIPALFQTFDVFVLPSHTEGLPRVILEAQATATPVIATSVGGVPEVVTDGETGLLCKPADPESLAEAIDRLAEDPVICERLGQQGRRQVADAFTWPELLDRYERFLATLIADRTDDEVAK